MTVAVVLVLLLVVAWVARTRLRRPSPEQRQAAAAASAQLRLAILARSSLQQMPPSPTGAFRAVVFDWYLGSGVATLVAYDDGTTSLYLSTGGGVLGAGTHERVRLAAERFRAEAARSTASFSAANDYPLPNAGHSTFYLVRDSATLSSGQILNAELESGRHALSALAALAQEVIAEVRRAS